MRREVRLLPAALKDLARLEAFLADKSPRAAVRAVDTIIAAVMSLEELPDRGVPDARTGLRELAIRFGRDGYTAQYRVDPSAVLIARIFHVRERR